MLDKDKLISYLKDVREKSAIEFFQNDNETYFRLYLFAGQLIAEIQGNSFYITEEKKDD